MLLRILRLLKNQSRRFSWSHAGYVAGARVAEDPAKRGGIMGPTLQCFVVPNCDLRIFPSMGKELCMSNWPER
jgi:hypothetical protein